MLQIFYGAYLYVLKVYDVYLKLDLTEHPEFYLATLQMGICSPKDFLYNFKKGIMRPK